MDRSCVMEIGGATGWRSTIDPVSEAGGAGGGNGWGFDRTTGGIGNAIERDFGEGGAMRRSTTGCRGVRSVERSSMTATVRLEARTVVDPSEGLVPCQAVVKDDDGGDAPSHGM